MGPAQDPLCSSLVGSWPPGRVHGARDLGQSSWDRSRGTTGQPSPGAEGILPFCPQDTCVALQALAEYAILSYAGGVNLTVSLASTNLDYQETFGLHRANQKVLQTAVVRFPGLGVGARGLPAHV